MANTNGPLALRPEPGSHATELIEQAVEPDWLLTAVENTIIAIAVNNLHEQQKIAGGSAKTWMGMARDLAPVLGRNWVRDGTIAKEPLRNAWRRLNHKKYSHISLTKTICGWAADNRRVLFVLEWVADADCLVLDEEFARGYKRIFKTTGTGYEFGDPSSLPHSSVVCLPANTYIFDRKPKPEFEFVVKAANVWRFHPWPKEDGAAKRGE